MIDEDEIQEAEAQFNLAEMELTTGLRDAHQEGNYLIGVTDKGVTFRHRLPVGKMLTKTEKGEYTLVDLRMS